MALNWAIWNRAKNPSFGNPFALAFHNWMASPSMGH